MKLFCLLFTLALGLAINAKAISHVYTYTGSVSGSTYPGITNGASFSGTIILDDPAAAGSLAQVRYYLTAGGHFFGAPDDFYFSNFDLNNIGGGFSGFVETAGLILGVTATDFNGIAFEKVSFRAGWLTTYYPDVRFLSANASIPDGGTTAGMLLISSAILFSVRRHLRTSKHYGID